MRVVQDVLQRLRHMRSAATGASGRGPSGGAVRRGDRSRQGAAPSHEASHKREEEEVWEHDDRAVVLG